MSVIQTLRGKGSVVVTVMLILALVAFIFMDSFQNNIGAIFQQDRTMVAEINGERMETQKYNVEYDQFIENMKANQQVESFSDEQQDQMREQFWNQQMSAMLINQESEALGLAVTEKERNAMFTSMDADQVVKQNFTDPQTGIFDPSKVIQYEQQVMQGEDVKMKKQWGNFKIELEKQRKLNKYISMIKMGIYVPKFLMDNMASQQNVMASIAYVKVPYESVNAESIKVTDAEIKEYMNERASTYKIDEDAVNLEYVSFPVLPAAKDSAAALSTLSNNIEKFSTSENAFDFASDNSDELSDESFYTANTLMNSNKEVLLAANVGDVVGPYYDNGMYKVSRITDRKSLPDSARASHIVIPPSDTLNEAQAKAKAENIEKQLKAGASFEALAASQSADQASAVKGGDLGYFAQGQLPTEFEDAVFNGSTGEISVLKLQDGFHVIKITDQKAFQPNVKIATMAKLLEPSQETSGKAQQKATDFAAKAKDEKTFTEAAKKLGQDKRVAQNVRATQGVIQGLGNVRQLVRWAYESEIGDVSPVLNFENQIIVARLVSKTKKGSMVDMAAVRSEIEAQLRRKKQVEQIQAKVKGASNLQSVASTFSTEIMNADSITMMSMSNPEIGYEGRVLGAAMNKKLTGKVSPAIPGQSGVFFVTVKNITDNMKTAQRIPGMERMQVEGQYMNSVDQMLPMVLKKRATITDNRGVSLNY